MAIMLQHAPRRGWSATSYKTLCIYGVYTENDEENVSIKEQLEAVRGLPGTRHCGCGNDNEPIATGAPG